MKEIKPREAKSLVERLGPHIDDRYDFTYAPVFPKIRKDVCAVRRMAEDSSCNGFDAIYIVWVAGEELSYECLIDSSDTRDYIHINEVLEDGGDIVIKVYSSGRYSGSAWGMEYRRSKAGLGLE